jgi:hypothetical protein
MLDVITTTEAAVVVAETTTAAVAVKDAEAEAEELLEPLRRQPRRQSPPLQHRPHLWSVLYSKIFRIWAFLWRVKTKAASSRWRRKVSKPSALAVLCILIL